MYKRKRKTSTVKNNKKGKTINKEQDLNSTTSSILLTSFLQEQKTYKNKIEKSKIKGKELLETYNKLNIEYQTKTESIAQQLQELNHEYPLLLLESNKSKKTFCDSLELVNDQKESLIPSFPYYSLEGRKEIEPVIKQILVPKWTHRGYNNLCRSITLDMEWELEKVYQEYLLVQNKEGKEEKNQDSNKWIIHRHRFYPDRVEFYEFDIPNMLAYKIIKGKKKLNYTLIREFKLEKNPSFYLESNTWPSIWYNIRQNIPSLPGGFCLTEEFNRFNFLIQLPPETDYYQEYLKSFHSNLSETTKNQIKELSIYQIQNLDLLQKYNFCLKGIEIDFLPPSPKETNEKNTLIQSGFHGTHLSNVYSILNYGLQRKIQTKYKGNQKDMYGRGIYMACNSSTVIENYSPPEKNGFKCIFLVNMIVGRSEVGKQNQEAPNKIRPDQGFSYHSTTDHLSPLNRTLYMAWRPEQILLKALFIFKM